MPAASVGRPDGLDAVSGAAVWMPYVTVYGVVAEVVRVRAGDHVGATFAANSVGVAALQVLGHLGALPIATCTSPQGLRLTIPMRCMLGTMY